MTAMRRSIPTLAMNASHDFMAFAIDAATGSIIEKAITHADATGDIQVVGSLEETIDYLSALPTPRILLVDMGATTDVMAAVEQLSEVCDPDARVILVGEVNDLHLYRDLIGMGIADYLIKPLTEDALCDTLHRLHKPKVIPVSSDVASSEIKQGHVIGVIGARGGAGASMIASNIAFEVSDALSKQVTLIDMDLTFGTQAVTFDVDPGAGLSDAMLEPGRMDELFIKRASTRIGDRLQLMAAETDPGRGDIASAEALEGLLGYIRQESDYVMIDVPRSLVVSDPEILEQFNTVMIIAEPTLPAMRDCARLKTLINKIKPDAKLIVVLNKVGIAGKDELPVATFEEGASLKIARKIAFEPRATLGAEAHGKCVIQVAPKAKISKDLKALAIDLVGSSAKKKRTSLGSIFSLNKTRPQNTESGAK